MASGIHVLCVDDDPDIRSVTAATLERSRSEFVVSTANSGRDGLSRLDGTESEPERPAIDCIVSDYEMPGMDGLEFLAAVRERDPEMPFLLFTGTGSEAIAREAISAGVTDYLQKGTGTDQYVVLANRIENAVEKRRAERARRESERELERYRTLVETVDDPMYVLDADGRCTIINDAFCDLLGVDRDRIVGEPIAEFISGEALERGAKTVYHLHESDRASDRFEFTIGTEDGTERVGEANVTALTDDDGRFAGSTAVVRDITARKRRERELARYERIVDLAPIALFVLDADATITWCNDEFADAFTEEIDALIGTPFPELIERGYYDERVISKYTDEVRALLSSSVDRTRAKYQVRFQSPDGEERIHDVHTELLPLEDGEFVGTIHAIRDITRRRRSQRELERQNDRLEEFASVVSHDLRNPLNVARGTLELHAEDCPQSGESIERVRWSLQRMDDLIDRLLSLARHGRTIGEQTPISLSTSVHRAWNAVDTADATLECDVDTTIVADEGRLQALLENLFRNAVEHGSTGSPSQAQENSVQHGSTDSRPQADDGVEHGSTSSQRGNRADDTVEHGPTSPDSSTEQDRSGVTVTVTVGPLEADASDDRPIRGFYVADDGSGLDSSVDELFEFGYTTAEDGTGFGLAIVEGIAEAHGWAVTARNGDDGGARFEISGVDVRDDRSGST
ncbi:multi-sensor signal transduction histidine kinase [Haloterrigena turkmenica DSM 5511]|uniref:histidine kinase n=1 Tax=Haloterrigena turkmenica (strain ATCC 51198 / DSM 5511 / JCM 9101 / NCIMB 13204 / VKM B-1734 / 4k) TaxID=543526 RepID=D2RPP9_HALTV|nr:PAS domain S-box protein [Haloterrigena turkmenica]ADB62201.1 multi-sensor signal transduction histidine kinase [Haloterrigena turkmenica DSM 5511]